MSTAPTIPFSPVSPEAPGARPGTKATPVDWLRRAVGDFTYLTLGLATGTENRFAAFLPSHPGLVQVKLPLPQHF